MLYLSRTDIAQTVPIPAPVDMIGGEYVFALVGQASRRDCYTVTVDATPAWQGQYIAVTLPDLSSVPVGEYDYELRDGSDVLTRGVARVEAWRDGETEYGNAEPIMQYE